MDPIYKVAAYIDISLRFPQNSTFRKKQYHVRLTTEERNALWYFFCVAECIATLNIDVLVRLGKSGLKVSRIILGCMSYGTPEWEKWVLPEEESIKIIKAAYVFRSSC